MNISLDFDETYTRDVEFWNKFIALAKQHNHNIYCVTLRSPHQSQEVLDSIGKYIGIENCHFTSMGAKKPHMWTENIRIDVWIDDMPTLIEDQSVLFNFEK